MNDKIKINFMAKRPRTILKSSFICFIIFVPDVLPNMTEADGR